MRRKRSSSPMSSVWARSKDQTGCQSVRRIRHLCEKKMQGKVRGDLPFFMSYYKLLGRTPPILRLYMQMRKGRPWKMASLFLVLWLFHLCSIFQMRNTSQKGVQSIMRQLKSHPWIVWLLGENIYNVKYSLTNESTPCPSYLKRMNHGQWLFGPVPEEGRDPDGPGFVCPLS